TPKRLAPTVSTARWTSRSGIKSFTGGAVGMPGGDWGVGAGATTGGLDARKVSKESMVGVPLRQLKARVKPSVATNTNTPTSRWRPRTRRPKAAEIRAISPALGRAASPPSADHAQRDRAAQRPGPDHQQPRERPAQLRRDTVGGNAE